MIKIIFIIDNLRIGGAQTHLLRLALALKAEGYIIEFICLSEHDELSVQYQDKLNIYHLKMDCIWKLGFWINFIKLTRYIAKIKPDIVHTYLNTSNVFGVLSARLAKAPVIISSRRDLGHFRSRIIGRLEEITAGLSNKVICVSEAVKRQIIEKNKVPPNKTVVIYNGVDESVFISRGLKNDKKYFKVAMIAAMDRKIKGHSYFIEAAKEIIKQRKDVEFILIGDGPLRADLEKQVNSNNIADYFSFKGKRNNLTEELKGIDIVISPSESEGCSNAILEAMAMGIPVIASAIEGNLEIIKDSLSGYLVIPKKPELIAEKIMELINTPEKIEKIGTAAQQRIKERFTLRNMVDNYIQLYEEQTKKRIGYIASLFPCWSETFILNEIIELEKNGVDITIFSLRSDLENFIQEETEPYLKKTIYGNLTKCIVYGVLHIALNPIIMISLFWMVVRKKHRNLKELAKYIWCIFTGAYFAKVALSKKLSHIHAHFATYSAFTALVISRLTKIPFTFTAHAHDIFIDKTFLKELTEEAEKVITISQYNKQYIIDYCKNGIADKIQVIHCGIKINGDIQNHRINNNTYTIVSIGRLTKMKGFEYLIHACSHIQGRIPFKCHIIGDGPLRSELLKLITKLGLQKQVFLNGFIDNKKVKKILQDATLFTLPCIWDNIEGQDGIPLVLMEAMALGTPVIASAISGIPELIENEKTGLLVKPGDDKELAEKITRLINDKSLQERITQEARIKIENEFNIAQTTDSLFHSFKL